MERELVCSEGEGGYFINGKDGYNRYGCDMLILYLGFQGNRRLGG